MFQWFKPEVSVDEYAPKLCANLEALVALTRTLRDDRAALLAGAPSRESFLAYTHLQSEMFETLNARRLELEAVKPDHRLSTVHNEAVLSARWMLTVANDVARQLTALVQNDRNTFARFQAEETQDSRGQTGHVAKLLDALKNVAETQPTLFSRLHMDPATVDALTAQTAMLHGDNRRDSSRMPQLSRAELRDFDAVARFVDWFVAHDQHVRELSGRATNALFEAGYRPSSDGVPHNPSSMSDGFDSVIDWFKAKFFMDLQPLRSANKQQFAAFTDRLNTTLSSTWRVVFGELGVMQGVDFEHFNLDVELQKIPVEDRERFQIGLMTETVLAAECRMLGWLSQCLFGEPYAPTKGVSAQASTAPLRPSPTNTEELQDLPF